MGPGLKRKHIKAFGAMAATAYGGYKRVKSYQKYTRNGRTKGIRSKNRPRNGGSRTKTKTKKRSQRSWDRDGNGIAYKNDTLTYKKSKQFKLTEILTAKCSHGIVFSGGSVSPQGFQAAKNITTLSTVEIKPFYETLNNGAPILPYNRSVEFNLAQIRYDLEFNNCGPAAMEVDIYHLIDKVTSITQNLGPKEEWDLGLADQGGPTYVPNQLDPWQSPNSVKRFNLLFWTRKYTKSLSPGEKIRLTLRHNVNRVLDYEHLQKFVTIRGITSRIFIVQRGTICDGNNDPVVAADRQTICRTKMVHMIKYQMLGQLIQSKYRTNVMNNLLPTAFINPLFDQNEGPGQPQNTEDGAEYA